MDEHRCNKSSRARNRVRLTPKIIREMKTLRQTTGIGVMRMLHGPERPEGLTPVLVYSWLAGTATTAKARHLAYVQQNWRSLHDKDRILIDLTESHIQEMRAHRDRTGLTIKGLLRLYPALADTVTVPQLGRWLRGNVRKVRKDQLDAVLTIWTQHPSRNPTGPKNTDLSQHNVHMTPDIYAQVDTYRQAGFLPGALFREATDLPAGLTQATVTGWLNGGTQTLDPELLAYVLAKCSEMAHAPQRRIPITDQMHADLTAQRSRTGLGPVGIFEAVPGLPSDLNRAQIVSWSSRTVKTVRKDHWDAVMAGLKALDNRH